MNIKQIGQEAYETGKAKGWYDNGGPTFAERIALCHSELSEALEAYRERGSVGRGGSIDAQGNEKPEGVPSELADVVIRIADLCEHLGIDLDSEIERKLAYNRTRSHRHGGKVL